MATGFQKSLYQNGNSSTNYESEDYSTSGKVSCESQEVRYERRSRQRHFGARTPYYSRKSKHFNLYQSYSIVYNVNFQDDTLAEHANRKESLDIHWPALSQPNKMKKSEKKAHNSSVKSANQTESYNPNGVVYPLWSTKEIVFSGKDDAVLRDKRTTQSCRVGETLLVKQEPTQQFFEFLKKPTRPSKSSRASKKQHHKTYAAVVQQEGDKFGRHRPSMETKTFLKVKGIKRKQVYPPVPTAKACSSNSSISSQSSLDEKYGIGYTAVSENHPEEIHADDEKFLDLNKNKTDLAYREYGDGDTITKAPELAYQFEEKERKREELTKNADISCNQKKDDPYYNPEQIHMRAEAEDIAIEGLDPKMACKVAQELWFKNKPRMPYTKMFSLTETNDKKGIESYMVILSPSPVEKLVQHVQKQPSKNPFYERYDSMSYYGDVSLYYQWQGSSYVQSIGHIHSSRQQSYLN